MEEAYREEHQYQGNWSRIVNLIQTCFWDRNIPTQLLWSTVVLLPKGNGDYRGIGLLEMNWKVIEFINNRRMASKVNFRDALHGIRAWRGTGTACIEAKVLQ